MISNVWWSRKLMWDQKLSLTTILLPNDDARASATFQLSFNAKIRPQKKICPGNCKTHYRFSENQQSQRVSIVMWIHFIRGCAYNLYFSLHPTASRLGDIVSIPTFPWSTFCAINRLVEGPELEWVRHWKVCFDLERPLSNQGFRHCRGTLSYKMPPRTHELLANFASLLQQ